MLSIASHRVLSLDGRAQVAIFSKMIPNHFLIKVREGPNSRIGCILSNFVSCSETDLI